MSENDHASGAGECGTDVAAYALGALEPAEAEAFQAHLQNCAVCRDELEAFQAVINALPSTAPAYRAPSELRGRVMAAVAREPRLPAADMHHQRVRRPVRRAITRPVLAFGATLALAAAILGGVELGASGGPQTHVYRAQVIGPGNAKLTLSSSGAKLTVRHFPPPPPGHVYEVWLQRGSKAPAPADALFSVGSNGSGDVEVPGDLHRVTKILVTPEPNGGSPRPTHTPVISVQLS